jgi:hypothetical protein
MLHCLVSKNGAIEAHFRVHMGWQDFYRRSGVKLIYEAFDKAYLKNVALQSVN